MSHSKVLVERKGPIALVTLNDPATRNALSPEMVAELAACVAQAADDPSLVCIVLAGAGEGFCSGGNLKDMADGEGPMFSGAPHQRQEGLRTGIQVLPRLFAQLDVPVVAAVHGSAVGAGCDLACMADIRVGSTTARFSESFLRVGLVSGDGGAWLLPRVIGMPRALEMALTCRSVDAMEASQWGLVNHVAEPEALLEKALEIARQIAAFAPVSVRLNKRLIRKSIGLGLDESLELSAAYQAIVQSTVDQKEALASLLERRSPKFTGA
jgi:2-(1,2-epoxy-1,2-dihydrophenyl)acetyl-CoA isomerase